MNAAAFLLFSLWLGLLVFVGGMLAERAAAEIRLPLRWSWLGAAWLAAILPVVAIASLDAPGAELAPAAVAGPISGDGERGANVTVSASEGAIDQLFGWWALSEDVLDAGAQRIPAWEIGRARVLVLWGGASLAFALLFILAHLRLRVRMNSWPGVERSGARFLLSPDVGPATVGFLRPRVVLPRWALELPDDALRLILDHEREHLRSRDNLTLWLGAVALLVCPWNPAVWMAARRLRLAVEMDCDARVLSRGTPVTEYGRVLLDVGSRGRLRLLTVAEMAASPSFLERRLTIMNQRFGRKSPVRAVGLGLLAGALLLAACTSDAPVATRAEEGRVEVSATADAERLVIRIEAAGGIQLNGEAATVAELGSALAPFGGREPGTVTVLEASEAAPYSVVAAVQQELRRAELLRVIFAAIGEDGGYLPTTTDNTGAVPGLGMVLPDTTMLRMPTTERGLRNVLLLEIGPDDEIDAGSAVSDVREGFEPAQVTELVTRSLQANPNLIVVLRTDPAASYGNMFRALDGIQAAGATRFSLQTLD